MPAEITGAAERELEWRECGRNFVHFVMTFCYIWVKEGGDPIPFKLWDFQVDAATKMQHKSRIIFLKARQLGLSWLASAYALWCVMFKKNFHVYYNSIGMKEVNEQMERIRFIYYNLPLWMQERVVLGGKDCKDNDSLIEFTNGSAIHATSSSKRAGHGAAPGLIICDEWARVEDAVRKWRAIKPSAGRKTKIFIISTSDGFGNHFAEMYHDAKAGKNGFEAVFYAWMDNPEYDEAYIEEQRRDFAGDVRGFKEAFPEKDEDAFLSASRSIFDLERIAQAKEWIRERDVKFVSGYIDWDGSERKFVPQDLGPLWVFEEPQEGHDYTIGADIAEGVVGGDWSVAVVLDKQTNYVVALFRAQIHPESYASPLEQLARWYNNAFLAVEVNTASDLIMSDLKQVYPHLYLRPQRQNIADIPTLVPGFLTTSTSRMRIITQLRREFSDLEQPLIIPFDIILDEMLTFEQNDKLKLEARSGYHDDCVMALAVAIEAKSTFPNKNFGSIYDSRTKRATWQAL